MQVPSYLTQRVTVTPSSTVCLTDTTEIGCPGYSSPTRWRSSSEQTDLPACLPGRELRPCTRVSDEYDRRSTRDIFVAVESRLLFNSFLFFSSFKHKATAANETHLCIFLLIVCRFLEPRGRHQAFRVSGRNHRRQVLLLLLLPAQHRGAVGGDRRQQPQKKPHVGHREPATLRQRAGRHGGGPRRQCPQATGPVPHEPATEFLRFLSLKPMGRLEEELLTSQTEVLSDYIKNVVSKKVKVLKSVIIMRQTVFLQQ